MLCGVAIAWAFIARVSAQTEEAPPLPTWQDQIAKGFVPYHQLTVDDFKIDDEAHPDASFWVSAFLHPRWHYLVKQNGDWFYAYVDQWIVFSGFDKNASSRKSKFREMKRSLPFAQAYVDIYEIHARQLAALKPGELPSGRGATREEAKAALEHNLDVFLKARYQPILTETDEFGKATDHGKKERKVLELGKAIRKRLDAVPASAAPGPEPPATSKVP
jgi:hypothetical protein